MTCSEKPLQINSFLSCVLNGRRSNPSNRTPPRPILVRMPELSGFLRASFELIADWLLATGDKGRLHLDPEEMTRSLAQKISSALRKAEILLRRLIWALAAEWALTDMPERAPDKRPRDRAPKPYRWRFAVFPNRPYNARAIDMLNARGRTGPRPPVRIGLILDRWRTLSGLAKDPTAAARRLARRFRQMKRANAIIPLACPVPGLNRLPGELGLLASFSLHETNTAMRKLILDSS
ncbi:hypothetical protein GCM10011503_19950 [Henriciella pelagia]|uniref:Transposase n=2 Tax=Henriciella pelagia TaxID=1977912 RepID=A0ABQ1JN56_9PROT|nr:hypothetical protein GCM10011503_19950 [Henriciella pelagia]